MIQTFQHPKSCAFAEEIKLTVNGTPVEVLRTGVADFANFIYDPSAGKAEVLIEYEDHVMVKQADIRPHSRKIEGTAEGASYRFEIDRCEKLSLEVRGRPPLFLWANPPETDRPSPEDPSVRWFRAGQVYEMGCFEMEADQTLYIEGGAVVKGRILTRHTDNISIRGHGIFDGAFFSRSRGDMLPSIDIGHCKNVVVRDITMIHPSGWMLLPGDCDHVEIFNLKQIGEVVSSDGIDVCGSRNVHIHDCFLRNNDDCVVIKAFEVGTRNLQGEPRDYSRNVENVLVENCTFLNAPAGNAMEIGHELTVDHVRDITFRNIDVLNVQGHGAVFSIHNYGSACVEKVVFENIRVEHCYDKFIDIRISRSRFTTQEGQGTIKDVLFKDIFWDYQPYNQGYTVSMIGGWDDDHDVRDVRFDNICLNDKPIRNLDLLEIYTRHTTGMRLLPPSGQSGLETFQI